MTQQEALETIEQARAEGIACPLTAFYCKARKTWAVWVDATEVAPYICDHTE